MAPSLSDIMTPDAAALARDAAGDGRVRPEAAPGAADLVLGLCRLGDNALILGHRVSEWCGHAPVLEEDIALANVALDLIGQTQLWLGYAAEVEGAGRSADDLAFLRDAWDFSNLLLVERPNRDFGHTLMRQVLFDAWHLPMLQAAQDSTDPRVAEIAAKAAKEVAYHLERSADLVIRLGDGTDESHARMQKALNALWPYAGEMSTPDAVDQVMADAGIAPDLATVKAAWDRTVSEVLAEATLVLPAGTFQHKGGKQGRHTEALGFILADMQFLQRAYPGGVW
jgi:ring-1,2-phenylacetyl-CoA epoxidase subunit PaaC